MCYFGREGGNRMQQSRIDKYMKIIEKTVESLIPYARNPRKNDQAVDAVAASIKEFGFKQPVVIDKDGVIVVGHTRVKAAKKLGIEKVPCVIASDLTPEQVKAYRLLDNKIAEKADWDYELLSLELDEIDIDLGPFDVELAQLDELAEGDSESQGITRQSLADRFIAPPFSVLDARAGWWQERKRAWLALGIQSELGRGGIA